MRIADVKLLPVLWLTFVGLSHAKDGPKEVTVNCTHGKSINDAIDNLDNQSKDYLVHVVGTCNENVLISNFEGNSLVLQGDPGAVINGVSSSPGGVPVIRLASSRLVRLENLTINVTGTLPTGNTTGISVSFCEQCDVRGVTINTPRSGYSATNSAGLVFDLTVNMTGSPAGTGLAAVNSSDLIAVGVQLHGPGGPPFTGTGLVLDSSSHVRLALSSATGTVAIDGFGTGILVRSGSHLDASTVCSGPTACGNITANGQGIRLENGTAFLSGMSINANMFGGVAAGTASTIEMTAPFNITNTSSGIGLSVSHNSHAALFNFGSTFNLSGNNPKQASVGTLSSLQFNGVITVNGQVNCDALSAITGTGGVTGTPIYACPNLNPISTPLP